MDALDHFYGRLEGGDPVALAEARELASRVTSGKSTPLQRALLKALHGKHAARIAIGQEKDHAPPFVPPPLGAPPAEAPDWFDISDATYQTLHALIVAARGVALAKPPTFAGSQVPLAALGLRPTPPYGGARGPSFAGVPHPRPPHPPRPRTHHPWRGRRGGWWAPVYTYPYVLDAPACVTSGRILASSGLSVHSAPRSDSPVVFPNDARYGQTVCVLATGHPGTEPSLVKEWWLVMTPGGARGYVAAVGPSGQPYVQIS